MPEGVADHRLRLMSILGLMLLTAIFVIGVALIVTNLGLLLLYALLVAALLAGSWLALSGSGTRRVGGTILTIAAVLGLGIVTWNFFGQTGNARRLLILIGLIFIYMACAAAVARRYWTGRRAVATPSSVQFRHPVLIVNPVSGDGRAMKAGIPTKARSHGIEVIMTEPGRDVAEMAQQAVDRGADVLGVSGGDGSLGAVAAMAIRHKLPLVVLPGGTRCHFARDIGLDPARIEDSLAAFEGVERLVDYGLINGRLFLNNASFGLYAEVIHHPEYREHKLDVTRREVSELAASDRPYYDLRFRGSDGQEIQQAALVLVGVNKYEALKLGELGTRRELDRGVLQVIAIPALDDQTTAQLAGSVALGKGGLDDWVVRRFTIADPSGTVKAGVDGESLELQSPVELEVVPRGLRLLVPAEGARSRPVKPVSVDAAKALWGLGRH